MPTKSAVKQIADNILEQAVKPTAREAANQINPMGRDLLKMLYWSDSTPPQTDDINKKHANYKANDEDALAAARKKHAELVGKQEEKPYEKTQPQNRSLIVEHHRDAQKLGVSEQDEEKQRKIQQERREEEEKLAREKAKKEALENPIEAPTGRQTGVSFGRKKPKSRMTKPPVSAETRGSNNRE